MAEVSNELLAEMLRRIQADIGDLKPDVREMRTRLGSLETQMASISTCMDRPHETLEHVIRRLDLREHSTPSV